MGCGPRAGLAEIFLPELQKGSLDHAGQGQPGDPRGRPPGLGQVIGNDTAITVGGMQGNFELNVRSR